MRLLEWIKGANCAVYTSHFLASWSGRMWMFSLGVFFISIAPGSLQLSAAYGLTNGAAVLLFGTVVGDWVDRTPRLTAALASMILQNIFVIICAGVVLVFLFVSSDSSGLDDTLKKVFYGIITVLSVLSRLMKIGRVIVIERDWIVEIAKSRETELSVMTSTFRRIDLVTKILAPIISGVILDHAGLKVGSVFIAAWTLLSLCVEYFLIRRVYKIVTVLREKKHQTIYSAVSNDMAPERQSGRETRKEPDGTNKNEKFVTMEYTVEDAQPPESWSPLRLLASFIIIYKGFRTYFSYDVKLAGLALAALYMTVLGFDGVTVGYATTQGLSSSLLGILLGTGAVFGICATFAYPFVVKCLGLARTGVLALGLQVTCLSLCVISVFLPGSPFDLNYSGPAKNLTSNSNCSSLDKTDIAIGTTSTTPIIPANVTSSLCTSSDSDDELPETMLSVYVMMAGIVTARFGLWMADLTIIQLILERVKTAERGVFNGFQSSLNQLMDFFKYALVAAIPFAHQFGLLIFISFSLICTGWTLMIVYCVKSSRKPQMLKEKNWGFKT